MNRSVVAAPFVPISFNIYSHRAAQGVIYADILKHMGFDISVSMSRPSVQGEKANEENKTEDFNRFDNLFMYHGNDWKEGAGQLNLFGGIREFPHAYNIRNISKFKGQTYSLAIDMPDYATMLKEKLDGFIEKNGREQVLKEFLEVDFDNLRSMQERSIKINPWIDEWENFVVGDSHAICMYRPGTNVRSIPFKTLHGALSIGLQNLIPESDKINSVEFYFGNIDIRHHVCRLSDGDVNRTYEIIRNLCNKYFEQVEAMKYDRKVIYELLPIENERRTVPQSGWYEKKPFWGNWHERNDARLFFREYMSELCHNTSVTFEKWVTGDYYNKEGELDFRCMERPKSVHLSRLYYPHWQGFEYNNEINDLRKFLG